MFNGKNNRSDLLQDLLQSFGIECQVKNNTHCRDVTVTYKGFSLTENFDCSWGIISRIKKC